MVYSLRFTTDRHWRWKCEIAGLSPRSNFSGGDFLLYGGRTLVPEEGGGLYRVRQTPPTLSYTGFKGTLAEEPSSHQVLCLQFSTHGFAKAIKMLPLREELEISLPSYFNTLEMVELVAGICLELKHFRLAMHGHEDGCISAGVASMVARMHKLRSLHLVRLMLDNEELATILDKCHDLEYLNMQECSLVDMDNMDDNLRVKLAQINMDNPEYSSDQQVDYEYKILPIYDYRELRDDWHSYYPDYNDSYEEYCYYIGSGDGIADADLEEYEKILDIKSMRRYLS
uniref:Uncharacterized protein n=1 Tax=Aegilops tauschii TaxID=37682 RepID=N1QS79_AEGTA